MASVVFKIDSSVHEKVVVATLIKAAKWGRASQPFNGLTTSAIKTFLKAAHRQSEFVIKHLPRSGNVKSRLPNGRLLRLRSRGDDWVSNQVYWREWHGYEPEVTPLFFHLAARARVTLDIGSHVGFYALLAAHANPHGVVYAFEPLPPIFERLERHVALNRLTNVQCINSAVGESDGEAEFFHDPTGLPTSSTLSTELKHLVPNLATSKVPVLTADGFVREQGLETVDLVKIDTETTEEQVLRGMRQTLARFHPNIICEVWGDVGMENWGGPERIMKEILSPLDYTCYALTKDGPVPYEGSSEEMNYLFTARPLDELLSGAD